MGEINHDKVQQSLRNASPTHGTQMADATDGRRWLCVSQELNVHPTAEAP